MNGTLARAALVVWLLAAVACGAPASGGAAGGGSAQPAASGPAPTAADAPVLASLSGAERDRVAGLIQAARQEGELDWLDAVVVPATAVEMGEAFKARYGLPNLQINHERAQTAAVAARIQEEVKADRVTVDVFAVASPRLFYDLKAANALLQYESPEYAHYDSSKKAGLTYEPGYWMSPVAYTFAPITNPKFYPKEIHSWNDLVDPQLRGKFEFPDVGGGEAALYTYIGLRKVMPADYMAQVAALQPVTNTGSSVSGTQKLASGELWLSVTLPSRLVQTVAQTGVQMNAYYPQEGVTMLGHPYGILAKAPHPNAAKLFVDWLFGEEGQSMYTRLEGLSSGRDGLKVPDEVRAYSPPLAEIKSIPLDWKNLDPKTMEAARDEYRQIFKR
ncbi:MAG TPA: extracellular solute-binding protein [Chloroflexota bacterium]|nr:extracellular solute-binding protein [Chloroflexota bacterium]